MIKRGGWDCTEHFKSQICWINYMLHDIYTLYIYLYGLNGLIRSTNWTLNIEHCGTFKTQAQRLNVSQAASQALPACGSILLSMAVSLCMCKNQVNKLSIIKMNGFLPLHPFACSLIRHACLPYLPCSMFNRLNRPNAVRFHSFIGLSICSNTTEYIV